MRIAWWRVKRRQNFGRTQHKSLDGDTGEFLVIFAVAHVAGASTSSWWALFATRAMGAFVPGVALAGLVVAVFPRPRAW